MVGTHPRRVAEHDIEATPWILEIREVDWKGEERELIGLSDSFRQRHGLSEPFVQPGERPPLAPVEGGGGAEQVGAGLDRGEIGAA